MTTTTNRKSAKAANTVSSEKLSKGERTRRRLLDAGQMLLERDGYHAMRVTDISAASGLSSGVFYIYFKDKDELSLVLFREACERAVSSVYSSPAPKDNFAAVLHALRHYVAIMLDGGGMIRAIVQILDQLPEARSIWLDMNGRVARRIADALEHRAPDAIRDPAARIIAAHAAQAMVDSMLLNIATYDHADLRDLKNDREKLAQALAVLWYRLLYASSPSDEEVPLASGFLPKV